MWKFCAKTVFGKLVHFVLIYNFTEYTMKILHFLFQSCQLLVLYFTKSAIDFELGYEKSLENVLNCKVRLKNFENWNLKGLHPCYVPIWMIHNTDLTLLSW